MDLGSTVCKQGGTSVQNRPPYTRSDTSSRFISSSSVLGETDGIVQRVRTSVYLPPVATYFTNVSSVYSTTVSSVSGTSPLTDESSALVSSFPMHLKDQTNPGKIRG